MCSYSLFALILLLLRIEEYLMYEKAIFIRFSSLLQSNWEGIHKDALKTVRSKLMEVITFNSAMNNFFIYVLLKENCKCNVKTHSRTYPTVIFLCPSLSYTTHLNSFLSGVDKKKKESKTRPPGRKGFSSVYNFFCALLCKLTLF